MFHNPTASTYQHTTPSTNPSVEPFHRSLPDYAVTPLIPLPDLAQQLGIGHILLKDESARLGLPAFKILGASWAIQVALTKKLSLPTTATLDELGAAARKEGVELYLGVKAVIFVPDFMDRATQEKIRGEGATVVVVDGDYDFSIEKAREEAEKEKGGMLVMDVSWEGYEEIPEYVVQGYITMLTETDKQLTSMSLPPLTHAIAAVGVGSWAQAVTSHYKASSLPQPATVITVEPDTAASLKTSLEKGKITPISTGHTICNGMNCGTTSTTAWEVLRKGVDGIRNGPCGAATMTALKRVCEDGKMKETLGLDETSVVVLFSTEGARDYIIPFGA
ncbi:uncharacterized protein J4E92_010887 [Alternaria infectoria]|uniref:uncharacterized protein n=1 Tax=Alternaria infectoria TaxID=45303 RepID=UPI00221F5EE5|nr:uncharacterized protein J4E92_010887 [Alternaria infectoria]KAI4908435.1 hypothetical protein J4E92_010887 [Alternaria infectoria]